ncbi:hypothetical protein FAZ95_07020 [Trinickia violacea]|uniref:Uncharacterized protein n=1 Tax=Trinickia violacea TaxID=2571746 RepID=A0A4P8IL41_9BURK|nr:hypothetical protein [Trinickia violacea]QCP48956.1 hypothetical protein FAZ95_07020 [Trinickia violacea]
MFALKEHEFSFLRLRPARGLSTIRTDVSIVRSWPTAARSDLPALSTADAQRGQLSVEFVVPILPSTNEVKGFWSRGLVICLYVKGWAA